MLLQTKTNPTLKDLDFTEMEENIMVGNSAKDQLMKALEADVQVSVFVSMGLCLIISIDPRRYNDLLVFVSI